MDLKTNNFIPTKFIVAETAVAIRNASGTAAVKAMNALRATAFSPIFTDNVIA